jgi:dihydrofolate reductase
MRQLTYYVACSIDRFIAREDGSFEGFLAEGEHIDDLLKSFPETFPAPFRDALGVSAENRYFDVVLMGRKTYEVGIKVGLTNPYPHLKQYLFSRTLKQSPDPNVELISTDAIGLVNKLKNETGKDIWLCGGADLASTLWAEKLIDGIILKINPFVMGSGIPLFSRKIHQRSMELTGSKIYGNGVAVLHYRVNNSGDRF